MPVSRGQRSTRPRGRASPRPQRWPIPFVPTSLEAERNSSEGEAPASRQGHIRQARRATYTWSSLPIRREAVSSIDMTSQPDKPLSFRQVAGASFAWYGRAVTPARTKAVITHATLLLGSARRHVPDGNWTAIAALRPRTGSWDSYDHEPFGPLVSPIARRTFLD